jgi:hypothetical protein
MDDETKIHLSSFEAELLNNSDWVLTKNVIIKKAQRLLESVQQNVTDYVNQRSDIFPPETLSISPKISKGENYRGLPWLMLDYPRYFNKENLPDRRAGIFAIRTMFWWGHYFSTTLHISGSYKKKYAEAIINAFTSLSDKEYYSCINEEEWHHHLSEENYVPVKNFDAVAFSKHIHERSFVKLVKNLSFLQWNSAVTLLSENFVQISEWLNQFPRR